MSEPLNGNKVVTRSIRPPRIAFIVETEKHCEAFIKYSNFYWGGKNFIAIPSKENKIDADWLSILEIYLPDKLYSFMELEEGVKSVLEEKEIVPAKLIDTKFDERQELGFSILDLFRIDEVLENLETSRKILAPVFSEQNIFNIARYGVFDTNMFWREFANWGVHLWKKELPEIIPLENKKVDKTFLEYVIEDERKDLQASMLMSDYTLRHLRGVYSADNFSTPLYVQQNQFIVSNNKNTVEDFCLYWFLRRQTIPVVWTWPEPIWISIDEFEKNVELIRQNKGQKITISSLSLTKEVIAKTIPENYWDDFVILEKPALEYFDPLYYVGSFDETVVNFEDGLARIPLPEHRILINFRQHTYCFLDVTISNFHLPQIKRGFWENHNSSSFDFKMMNFDIQKQRLSFFMFHAPQSRAVDVRLPSDWEIISTIAAEAGYKVKLSDKGLMAEKLLELIGGIDNVWIFSDENILNLIEDMSELYQAKEFKGRLKYAGLKEKESNTIIERMTTDRHDRVMKTFSAIRSKGKLGKETEGLINWLLERNLVERGREVSCTNCNTKQWLSVNEFQKTIRCRGCFAEIDIPLRIDSTHWQYRLNTLFARSFDQGIIPHLLTVFYYLDIDSRFRDNSFLGNFYGLVFEEKDNPKNIIEVDVLTISNGKVVIGECKKNAFDLKISEVKNLCQLANKLHCDEVLFSFLDSEDNLQEDVRNEIKSRSMKIHVIDKGELTNRYWGRADHELHNKTESSKLKVEVLPTFIDILKRRFA